MEMQLVVFELSGEFYAVEISQVVSIIKKQVIARVPHMPSFVEGVMNLRGKVVPVMDLRKRFGEITFGQHEEPEKTMPEEQIMVVNVDGNAVGLVVDTVVEILTVLEDQIEPISPVIAPIEVGFFKGIAKVKNQLLILINLSAVVSIL